MNPSIDFHAYRHDRCVAVILRFTLCTRRTSKRGGRRLCIPTPPSARSRSVRTEVPATRLVLSRTDCFDRRAGPRTRPAPRGRAVTLIRASPHFFLVSRVRREYTACTQQSSQHARGGRIADETKMRREAGDADKPGTALPDPSVPIGCARQCHALNRSPLKRVRTRSPIRAPPPLLSLSAGYARLHGGACLQ